MPSATQNLTRPGDPSRRVRVLCALLPALAALAVNLIYGPFVIDDTYIGLRYIENMAQGRGLMFNPGEPVLGISCPLYCLLLVLVRLTGIDLVMGDVAIGVISVSIMTALVVLIALRHVRPATAAALGLFIALFPVMPFTANSGMETGASLALIHLTFYALFTRRFALAGTVAGVEVLVRPDAAIIAGLAGLYVLINDRNKIIRFIVPITLVIIPWIVYATFIYGSPIPHSIAAKRANHLVPHGRIIQQLAILAILLLPLSIFALAGMVRSWRRRSELLAVAGWVVLYAAGLVLARIDPILFIWYFSPFLPAWALLAATGLDPLGQWLAERSPPGSRRQRLAIYAPATALIILALAFGAGIFPLRAYLLDTGYKRAGQYLEIGDWLARRARPGDVIMVAECGAISYALMDHYIFDQSGLNNPEVYDLCRIGPEPGAGELPDPRPRFLTAACELALIKDRQPEYITTFNMFMHVRDLEADPWFSRNYRRVPYGGPEFEYHYIYQKVPGPG